MIVEFHGMKCRYSTYRTNGEDKNILTLVNAKDWEKSLQYDFQSPFLTHVFGFTAGIVITTMAVVLNIIKKSTAHF